MRRPYKIGFQGRLGTIRRLTRLASAFHIPAIRRSLRAKNDSCEEQVEKRNPLPLSDNGIFCRYHARANANAFACHQRAISPRLVSEQLLVRKRLWELPRKGRRKDCVWRRRQRRLLGLGSGGEWSDRGGRKEKEAGGGGARLFLRAVRLSLPAVVEEDDLAGPSGFGRGREGQRLAGGRLEEEDAALHGGE